MRFLISRFMQVLVYKNLPFSRSTTTSLHLFVNTCIIRNIVFLYFPNTELVQTKYDENVFESNKNKFPDTVSTR